MLQIIYLIIILKFNIYDPKVKEDQINFDLSNLNPEYDKSQM